MVRHFPVLHFQVMHFQSPRASDSKNLLGYMRSPRALGFYAIIYKSLFTEKRQQHTKHNNTSINIHKTLKLAAVFFWPRLTAREVNRSEIKV